MRVLAALVSVSASLHITVWPDGRPGPHHVWTLRCGTTVGGTLPHRATACERLSRRQNPFAPVPPDVACSEIFGGPQTALVTGRFRGRRVNARFNRRNGCEIARWNRVQFLLR
jgi:Subtilisin inhibitor-like